MISGLALKTKELLDKEFSALYGVLSIRFDRIYYAGGGYYYAHVTVTVTDRDTGEELVENASITVVEGSTLQLTDAHKAFEVTISDY